MSSHDEPQPPSGRNAYLNRDPLLDQLAPLLLFRKSSIRVLGGSDVYAASLAKVIMSGSDL
jgi:hypothetical protein